MKIVSLEGSYSTGKSTVFDRLPKNKGTIYTPDLAREYLNKNRMNSNNMSQAQKKDLQLFVSASYLGGMKQAVHAQKDLVQDSSLITAYAYSEDVLPPNTLVTMAYELAKYRDHMFALIFPPTIHLENDGLRHIDPEFRVEIHKRIMNVIQAFDIPYQYIVSQDIDDRVAEAESYIQEVTKQ